MQCRINGTFTLVQRKLQQTSKGFIMDCNEWMTVRVNNEAIIVRYIQVL